MTKRVALVVLILAAIAAGVFAYLNHKSGPHVSLAFRFKQGQVDKYRVSLDVGTNETIPGRPKGSSVRSRNESIAMTLAQQVQRVNIDGSADIVYTITGVKEGGHSSSNGRAFSFSVTVGSDGKILKMDPVAHSEVLVLGLDLETLMTQIWNYRLPRQSVGVGERWDGKMDIPGLGSVPMAYAFDTDGELVGRTKAARVTGEFSYDGTFGDLAKSSGPAAPVRTSRSNENVSLRGNGALYLDRAAGKLLKVDSTLSGKMEYGHGSGSGSSPSDYSVTLNIRAEKIK